MEALTRGVDEKEECNGRGAERERKEGERKEKRTKMQSRER